MLFLYCNAAIQTRHMIKITLKNGTPYAKINSRILINQGMNYEKKMFEVKTLKGQRYD